MKKYKLIILVCLIILVGCSSLKNKLPTSNKGRYTVMLGKYKSKSENQTVTLGEQVFDVVTIRGHVFDVKTGKPLSNATVIEGCFKFQTTSEGEYSFKTRNLKDNSFYMEAIVYPYRPVDTDIINIYNRKEVIIDFYLAIDDRPMFDCTTGWSHDQMQKELNNLK
ncbi:hypothetical protein SAMN05444484_106233 [Flavobacterium chilense]|uniref:Lipoprotein n=1 Tax=Flavobacterium chilense TaxID=946677 RepID=A0A1M7J9I5_9FLAO|nr:hypothetical protein SAMN05444484_106233 [Flavobacterium chilense]